MRGQPAQRRLNGALGLARTAVALHHQFASTAGAVAKTAGSGAYVVADAFAFCAAPSRAASGAARGSDADQFVQRHATTAAAAGRVVAAFDAVKHMRVRRAEGVLQIRAVVIDGLKMAAQFSHRENLRRHRDLRHFG